MDNNISFEYIAGLFDGEGCINTVFRTKKYGKPTIMASVTIANTVREPLDVIQNIFGGKVYVRKRYRGWQTLYTWKIYSKEKIQKFLSTILPFSIIKKDQIKLMLDLMETIATKYDGGFFLGNNIHQKRLEIHNRLRELKNPINVHKIFKLSF